MLVSRIAMAAALVLSLGTTSALAASEEINLGQPASTQAVPFQIYFPLTNTAKLDQLLEDLQNPAKQEIYHHWLTPAQFKAQFGADPAKVAKVKAALTAAGMKITGESSQKIDVVGTALQVQSMFKTKLTTMHNRWSGQDRFVAADTPPTMPKALLDAGAMPVGFESRVLMHTFSRATPLEPGKIPAARLNLNPVQGYFFNDMKAAYSFPSFQTTATVPGQSKPLQIAGIGTNIGILISSIAQNSDLALQLDSKVTLNSGAVLVQDYSTNSNLPVPTFTIREVSGGSGPFGNGAADEASLDTQASLGSAQGATEQVYDIPDLSDSSVLAGYTAIDEDNTVDVVSSSFGGCEFLEITANVFTNFVSEGFVLNLEHQLYEQGNAQGITFVASSGDEGSLACSTDLSATGYYNAGGTSPDSPQVSEPAADPNVTGVGGTNLATTSTAAAEDTYVEENSFGDPLISPFDEFGLGMGGFTGSYWGSGGGISEFFAKPSYQNLVPTRNATQRTSPDVALQMGGCPGGITANPTFCNSQERSFSLVVVNNQLEGLIGTSSSSPQFAGVLALLIEVNGGGSGLNTPGAMQANAPIGRLGNVNPLLYMLSAQQNAAGGPRAPSNLQFFHRKIQGFAGFWGNDTDIQYSYVLGVGTPNVMNLLQLPNATPAGNPGTITNP
jgi:subtilase family serine protease